MRDNAGQAVELLGQLLRRAVAHRDVDHQVIIIGAEQLTPGRATGRAR